MSQSTTIGFYWTHFLKQVSWKWIFGQKCPKLLCRKEILILKNGGDLYFNQMEELLILPMTFHINESSMENILSFAEVVNIEGVDIKMDTLK